MLGRLSFFFQAEDGIRDHCVTGVQTCALPISKDASVATYSTQTSLDLAAASVAQMRQQKRLSGLQRLNSGAAQAAACSMAQANSINTPMSREMARSRYLLRYTSNQPQSLPSSAPRAISDRSIRAFAVGSCYARTASYPNGVYWVALMFY